MDGWVRRSFLYWVQGTFQGRTVYMFVSKHGSCMIYVWADGYVYMQQNLTWNHGRKDQSQMVLAWFFTPLIEAWRILSLPNDREQTYPQHCWVETDTVSLQVVLICVLLSKRCSDIKFIIGLKSDWLLYFSMISDVQFMHEFMGYFNWIYLVTWK